MKKIFITGSAGFIGFHLSKLLLESGHRVHGYDGITDYYDIELKKKRHSILTSYQLFEKTVGLLENREVLEKAISKFQPEIVIHLAAQAGVRYSIENPKSYVDSNLIGFFNILDLCKKNNIKHLLMASTSSVYGSNTKMPFRETDKSDTQLSLYAATKKANENIAHSYSHLFDLPITMFRFFTVYGPWGRPDLALFKFVDAILNNEPIQIYNNGDMFRDFTYVEDLVKYIELLIDTIPNNNLHNIINNDSLSDVAPFRIVNIGNSEKIKLLDFIEEIEKQLGKKAIREYLPLQQGDVISTHADISLLKNLVKYESNFNISEGIKNFIYWFRDYYNK